MATKIQPRIGSGSCYIFHVKKPKLEGSKVNIPDKWKKEVQMMTPTRIKLTYALIILISIVAITDESGGITSAFLNQTVNISDCTHDIRDFKVDGKEKWSLPANFLSRIKFDNSNSCSILTIPALPTSDQDTIFITFILSDDSTINYTLHVQGVLKKPYDFAFRNVNATHIILVWDEPYSWVIPADIRYHLTLTRNTSRTVWLTIQNHSLLRPAGGLYATLTPWNPVGEGESTTLNLTDSVLSCDNIGDIIHPKALPYYNRGSVSVTVLLFTVENGRYCFPETVVVNINDTETSSAIEIRDGKAVLVYHGVPEEMHVTATIPYFNSEFNFSTYKVQGVTVSGSSHEPMVECHFLDGSTHNTCYITVAGDESAFSGDARYTITRPPGQYTLLVYDDERQKNTGKDPALTKNITIEKESREDGALFGILPLLILPIFGIISALIIAVKCYNRRGGRDGNADDPAVRSATDEENTDLVVSDCRRRGRGHVSLDRRDKNTVDNTPQQLGPDAMVLPTGNSYPVPEYEDKGEDVVEGVENPELHAPSQQETYL